MVKSTADYRARKARNSKAMEDLRREAMNLDDEFFSLIRKERNAHGEDEKNRRLAQGLKAASTPGFVTDESAERAFWTSAHAFGADRGGEWSRQEVEEIFERQFNKDNAAGVFNPNTGLGGWPRARTAQQACNALLNGKRHTGGDRKGCERSFKKYQRARALYIRRLWAFVDACLRNWPEVAKRSTYIAESKKARRNKFPSFIQMLCGGNYKGGGAGYPFGEAVPTQKCLDFYTRFRKNYLLWLKREGIDSESNRRNPALMENVFYELYNGWQFGLPAPVNRAPSPTDKNIKNIGRWWLNSWRSRRVGFTNQAAPRTAAELRARRGADKDGIVNAGMMDDAGLVFGTGRMSEDPDWQAIAGENAGMIDEGTNAMGEFYRAFVDERDEFDDPEYDLDDAGMIAETEYAAPEDPELAAIVGPYSHEDEAGLIDVYRDPSTGIVRRRFVDEFEEYDDPEFSGDDAGLIEEINEFEFKDPDLDSILEDGGMGGETEYVAPEDPELVALIGPYAHGEQGGMSDSDIDDLNYLQDDIEPKPNYGGNTYPSTFSAFEDGGAEDDNEFEVYDADILNFASGSTYADEPQVEASPEVMAMYQPDQQAGLWENTADPLDDYPWDVAGEQELEEALTGGYNQPLGGMEDAGMMHPETRQRRYREQYPIGGMMDDLQEFENDPVWDTRDQYGNFRREVDLADEWDESAGMEDFNYIDTDEYLGDFGGMGDDAGLMFIDPDINTVIDVGYDDDDDTLGGYDLDQGGYHGGMSNMQAFTNGGGISASAHADADLIAGDGGGMAFVNEHGMFRREYQFGDEWDRPEYDPEGGGLNSPAGPVGDGPWNMNGFLQDSYDENPPVAFGAAKYYKQWDGLSTDGNDPEVALMVDGEMIYLDDDDFEGGGMQYADTDMGFWNMAGMAEEETALVPAGQQAGGGDDLTGLNAFHGWMEKKLGKFAWAVPPYTITKGASTLYDATIGRWW